MTAPVTTDRHDGPHPEPARQPLAPVTHLRGEAPPEALIKVLAGAGGLVAGANIVMQLANLKVGHGVAESRVERGSLYAHPIKRARTTFGYVGIALWGTDEEREVLSEAVTRVHRQVRNLPGEAVRYSALDPKLQLWVAACIYRGMEDAHRLIHGEPTPEVIAAIYPHAARLATTLQVPPERWPPDRDAFEAYWQAEVATIEMDDVTRSYLWDFAGLGFLPTPIPQLFGRFHRIVVAGALAPEFRDELGLPWGPLEQRVWDVNLKVVRAMHRVLPQPLLEAPIRLYLWDMRRRIRNRRNIL